MSSVSLRTFVVSLALLTACEKHDIGKPCPALLACEADGDCPGSAVCDGGACTAPPAPEGEARADTLEVIEQNVGFPCEELVCVATAGREGYCTKKCREDAGCPDGFVCREVQPVGEFAGEMFCVWKECERRGQCGNKEDFCCLPVPGSDPIEELKFCAFANEDGKCD